MNFDLRIVLKAVQETFSNPTGDLVTSMFVISAILLLMLILVMGLLLAGTPKQRRVVKRRRYRRTAGDPAEGLPGATDGEAASDAGLVVEEVVLTEAGEAPDATTSAIVDEEAHEQPAGRLTDSERQSRFRAGASKVGTFLTGAFAVPVLVGAAVVAGYVVTGTDAYCVSACHNRQEMVHRAVEIDHASCVGCHESPRVSAVVSNLSSRARMVYRRTAGETPGGLALVESASCLGCHQDVLEATIESDRGIRMSHIELNEAGRTCVSCHTGSGHTQRRDYSMSSCITCHGGQSASTECVTCHTDDPYDATKRAEGGRESSATIGSGKVSYPVTLVGDRGCGGCHNEPRDCDSCHGLRMPHSTQFRVRSHARMAAWEKKQMCYKCHTPNWCASGCHISFEAGHVGNWKQDHKSAPRDSGCVCHQGRTGRKEPMCVICHDW